MKNWSGLEIRRLRKELGLTQAEFAEKLGYSRQGTVSDIENDRREVSPVVSKLLDQLAQKAYSLSSDEQLLDYLNEAGPLPASAVVHTFGFEALDDLLALEKKGAVIRMYDGQYVVVEGESRIVELDDIIGLPMVEVNEEGTELVRADDGGFYYLNESLARWELGMHPKRVAVMRVVGDSMMPTLNPREIAFISTEKGLGWQEGGIYVLLTSSGPKVKAPAFRRVAFS